MTKQEIDEIRAYFRLVLEGIIEGAGYLIGLPLFCILLILALGCSTPEERWLKEQQREAIRGQMEWEKGKPERDRKAKEAWEEAKRQNPNLKDAPLLKPYGQNKEFGSDRWTPADPPRLWEDTLKSYDAATNSPQAVERRRLAALEAKQKLEHMQHEASEAHKQALTNAREQQERQLREYKEKMGLK